MKLYQENPDGDGVRPIYHVWIEAGVAKVRVKVREWFL